MKPCYIIGGGSSLKDFDFKRLKNKDCISVNESVFVCPSKYFVTVDYSWMTELRKKSLKYNLFVTNPTNKFFIANLKQSGLEYKDNLFIWNNKQIYDLTEFDIVIRSRTHSGFGSWGSFANGINSGFSALQLALCLGYTQIYLLGIDLHVGTQTHFHTEYKNNKDVFNQKLNQYFENFYFSLRDFKKARIISCSEFSPLNNILPYKPLDEI